MTTKTWAVPDAAVIEIVEKGASTDGKTGVYTIVAPTEVRINGIPLLCSADEPIVVHEISTKYPDAIRVTLTLFARRVFIGAEGDLPKQGD